MTPITAWALAAVIAAGCTGGEPAQLVDDSFGDFAQGTLGEGGVRLYASADGSVRLIETPDIDRDGFPDVVVSNVFDGTQNQLFGLEPLGAATCAIDSYVYFGSQDGLTPDRRTSLPTSCAFGNAVADLDADGYPDVAFANHLDDVGVQTNSYVYYGGPDGLSADRRTELPTTGASTISVIDLNRDGWLDLLFANNHAPSAVFWGAESGFTPDNQTTFETIGGFGSTVADVNLDGWPDLLFCNFPFEPPSLRDAYLYYGGPDGYSAERRIGFPTDGCYDASVADLNADGFMDVLFSNSGDGIPRDSTIFWGGANGFSVANSQGLPTLAAHCNDIADLDEDGFLDLVIANVDDGTGKFGVPSYIYWGSADGYDANTRTEISSVVNIGTRTLDLDADGHLDVVLLSRGGPNGRTFADRSFVYWGTGTRTFDRTRTSTTFPTVGAHMSTTTDLGTVLDRTHEHVFTSRIWDVADATFSSISWTAEDAPEGSIQLQVRSSARPEDLADAPWSGPTGPNSAFTQPGDLTDAHRGHRLVQYRARIRARRDHRPIAPVLQRVEITYVAP